MIKNSFKKDNELEYRKVYNMFYNRIYRDAYFIAQDTFLAEDIVQDTFIKGFIHMESLKDKDKLGAWLATIATRIAIDLIRKQKSWNEILTEDEYMGGITMVKTTATIEDIVEKNMLKEELMKRVQNLHYKHREILLLKYIHELKEKEIAEWVDVKEGTVKSRIHRAKKALRTEIEQNKQTRF